MMVDENGGVENGELTWKHEYMNVKKTEQKKVEETPQEVDVLSDDPKE